MYKALILLGLLLVGCSSDPVVNQATHDESSTSQPLIVYLEEISANILAVERSLQVIEDELHIMDSNVRLLQRGAISQQALKEYFLDAASIMASEADTLVRLREEAMRVYFPPEAAKHRELFIDYINLRRLATSKVSESMLNNNNVGLKQGFDIMVKADAKNRELMAEALSLAAKANGN